MKKIYFEDIDLDKLHTIEGTTHKESTIFYDETTIYKIFDDLYGQERKNKQTKVELLGDGLSLPNTVMPREEIVYEFLNNRFEGYTMDYIKHSKTLYKTFLDGKNIDKLVTILNTISKSLEIIHKDPRNIILSDVHVENIIIDKQFNPYIIDIDSCKIDGLKNDSIPMTLKHYLQNRHLFRSMEETETTKNTDKLCFLMMIIGLIFNKQIDRISIYEYDEKMEDINILKNMREIILEIRKSKTIPEVPYFHEIIIPKLTKKLTK